MKCNCEECGGTGMIECPDCNGAGVFSGSIEKRPCENDEKLL